MQADRVRWDVFCRVVDHFGDAAVAWRLARLLAREHGKRVRLWLDDLTVLSRLRGEIDPAREAQSLEGVEVIRWREAVAPGEVADVVVETFGCDPPEAYVAAMAAREPRPRWINLEYLSAEAWVEGSHARPSPHPRLPLTKHFFFPGFTPATGGLLREHDLFARRDAFQSDPGTARAFWRLAAGREPPEGALKVSLFGYAGAPLESAFEAWSRHSRPVWCAVPEGAASAALEKWLGGRNAGERGSLQAFVMPFLAQDAYDELLWACDVNFVRGEDSFVRAQWAARPFVWQIYPTQDGAHWIKLGAFLARYAGHLDREHAAAVTALWEAWNRGEGVAGAWAGFAARLETIGPHARAWAARLGARRDLAAELVDFVDNLL